MDKLFDIATSISTPLALGGFFAAVIFYVFRQIVAKNIYPKLNAAIGADLLKLIIERLFVLALIAMILGFVAYLVVKPMPVLPPSPVSTVPIPAPAPSAPAPQLREWHRADEGGRLYSKVFSHDSEDRHNKGAKIASGTYRIDAPNARIYEVRFRHEGEACGWNYHPVKGYDGYTEVIEGGRAFLWKRKWDGSPCREYYEALYDVFR